jgi:hypothetical protein
MPNNGSIIAELTNEVVRELDLGEYADALAGKKLQIQVNPPSIIEEVAGKDPKTVSRMTLCKVVSLFTNISPDAVAKFDDTLLYWVYGKSLQAYNDFHSSLKKK